MDLTFMSFLAVIAKGIGIFLVVTFVAVLTVLPVALVLWGSAGSLRQIRSLDGRRLFGPSSIDARAFGSA
jgi:hypothetical protein